MSVITQTKTAPANIRKGSSLTQAKLERAQLTAWGMAPTIPHESMSSTPTVSTQTWSEQQAHAMLDAGQLQSHNNYAQKNYKQRSVLIDDLDEAIASANRGIGLQSMMRRAAVPRTNSGLVIHDPVGNDVRRADQGTYRWTSAS